MGNILHFEIFRPTRPVTLNMGMRMPAWFDIYGLSLNSNEDVDGINEATKTRK